MSDIEVDEQDNERRRQDFEMPPNQRIRLSNDMPFDRNLIGSAVMQTEEILIQDLLNEDVEFERNLSRTHLNVQILRILSPKGQAASALTRCQNRNNQQTLNHIRTFLCRNRDRLCCIMITSEANKRIFHRDLLPRDNGTITIGSCLRIVAPLAVERNMQGIPLVNSCTPAIAMEPNHKIPAVNINHALDGNQHGVGVLKNAQISVRRLTPIQTTYSGKHCDKQRPLDWSFSTSNRSCGCWGTSSLGASNIALMRNIALNHGGVVIKMLNFSSAKFNALFMDRPMPPNTMASALERAQASNNLEDCMTECLDFINEEGGFQVALWHSRGEINDQSLVGMNTQDGANVDAGKMNYHIVEIIPADHSIMNRHTALGQSLNMKKFKVGNNL